MSKMTSILVKGTTCFKVVGKAIDSGTEQPDNNNVEENNSRIVM